MLNAAVQPCRMAWPSYVVTIDKIYMRQFRVQNVDNAVMTSAIIAGDMPSCHQ